MKAVVVRRFGGPEVLETKILPDPEPAPGEVVVRVRATSVNHRDVWMRYGRWIRHLPETGFVPGSDVAGIVEAVGPGVEGWSSGERCVAYPAAFCGHCRACLEGRQERCPEYRFLEGAYAERACVPANLLRRIPDEVSFEEAACLPVSVLTAWHMMVGRGRLRPGENVLVWGAGGGVGSAALRIGAYYRCRVFAVVSSAQKAERALQQGAAAVIDRSRQDVVTEVRQLTHGEGVDLVVDSVGGATVGQDVRISRQGGRIVLCGTTGGDESTLDVRRTFLKEIEILGASMGSPTEFERVLALAAGPLHPIVDRRFPLQDAAEAHLCMEEGRFFGKLVLVP